MVQIAWKISMWSIISHNSLHKLLRLYSFKVLFMFIFLRWTKQRKNKSVKNAKPKISAALNYRKKLLAKTNLSMRMNDIHALFMKKWNVKKYVIHQLQVIFALSRTILVWDQLKSKQFDHVIVQKGKAFEFGCAFNFLLYSLQLAAFENDLGQFKTFFLPFRNHCLKIRDLA